jgi:Fur family ferric uptake transcriptional regulator
LTDARLDTAARGPQKSPWDAVAPRLRAAGLRWTHQRRMLVDVLKGHEGHVMATEIIARCRELDPSTTPSTVYRTLDVLENLGLVRHGHGPDGREEYHVLPQGLHGHVYCSGCGRSWEIAPATGAQIADALEQELGFEIDLSHVTISGLCQHCQD